MLTEPAKEMPAEGRGSLEGQQGAVSGDSKALGRGLHPSRRTSTFTEGHTRFVHSQKVNFDSK